MISPHEQTINRFGIDGQRAKLIEELHELLDELETDKPMDHYDVVNEMSDVQNVIESINVWANGAVNVAADTKMLRTQIRMRNGYYDENM